MSIREQTYMVCDGTCGTEVAVRATYHQLPDKWAKVEIQGENKGRHYCPDCWLRGALAILTRPEPRTFNPTLD